MVCTETRVCWDQKNCISMIQGATLGTNSDTSPPGTSCDFRPGKLKQQSLEMAWVQSHGQGGCGSSACRCVGVPDRHAETVLTLPRSHRLLLSKSLTARLQMWGPSQHGSPSHALAQPNASAIGSRSCDSRSTSWSPSRSRLGLRRCDPAPSTLASG